MRERNEVYRDVMTLARRRIDEARWRYDRERAAVERAHLALIPPLLRCTDERRHHHYLDVERPRFVRACRAERGEAFDGLWAELEAMLPPAEAKLQEIPFARAVGPFRLDYESAS